MVEARPPTEQLILDGVRSTRAWSQVIRGVGGASDGKGKGITAPNPVGQQLAMTRAWQAAGLPVVQVSLVTIGELYRERAEGSGPCVLDVRQDAEWRAGHLAGALHIDEDVALLGRGGRAEPELHLGR